VARLTVVIFTLTALGLTLVHIRRQEARVRHEIQDCQTHQVRLRRRLWDQRLSIGRLTCPRQVRDRVEMMALDLTGEDEDRTHLARRSGRAVTADRGRR